MSLAAHTTMQRGPDALSGIGAVSARLKPMHHAIGYLSDRFKVPGAHIGGLSVSAATPPWRRKLVRLRPDPSFSRPHANDFSHGLLAPYANSVSDNRMMAWSNLNETQKAIE